jgi:hypothetical protein
MKQIVGGEKFKWHGEQVVDKKFKLTIIYGEQVFGDKKFKLTIVHEEQGICRWKI